MTTTTQDWFMMTGDMIINLRSNKTGDSFRFRTQPSSTGGGNTKLSQTAQRQATFSKDPGRSQKLLLTKKKKPRSSSLEDDFEGREHQSSLSTASADDDEEEEEEDNEDNDAAVLQSSSSPPPPLDDHHTDQQHQQSSKRKQKQQQEQQQKHQQQKQQLLKAAAAAAAAEQCSAEEQTEDSSSSSSPGKAVALSTVESSLPGEKEEEEEEGASPISKSKSTEQTPSSRTGTFNKASGSVSSSSNSSASSSGNSSGGVTTTSTTTTTTDEELSNSNSFSSSDGLTSSSNSSSTAASPEKTTMISGSHQRQEQQQEDCQKSADLPQQVNNNNNSSERQRTTTTTTKQKYSPEQFCHYYDENYDSKQQQQQQQNEEEEEAEVEENTYENIGETLANHYSREHHHHHHNRHPLSKSEESNLYNLIEDSKSFDSISLEEGRSSDGGGGEDSSSAQYSTSSKLPSNHHHHHQHHQQQQYIDAPSANRLAKRLFHLEGFQKDDVTRHLSKNNEYSRTVAEEYLRLFDFSGLSLDEAVRRFLARFHLTGETQERERVLVYFAKRYAQCNEGQEGSGQLLQSNFASVDAIHTLTCALMLLNTDLHEENIQRKMTCADFILNLAGLNDGGDFSPVLLKALYHSIKGRPLGWNDDDLDNSRSSHHHHHRNVFSKITTISKSITGNGSSASAAASAYATLPRKFLTGGSANGGGSSSSASMMSSSAANCSTLCSSSNNPFIEPPNPAAFAIEYKKGYIRRKCCYEANGKRTPLGRRGWRLFYATLRDLVLYLHRDENGFRKSQLGASHANSIRIHHAIAAVAGDYPKKKFVFRLVTADCAEYLFETSDSRELQSWVDTINTTAASLSAPALPSAVGSTDGLPSSSSSTSSSFRRELLPVSHTKLSLRDQLADQERKLLSLQRELELLLEKSGRRSTNKIYHRDFVERESYLQHEVTRYRTYITCLKWKLKQQQQQQQQQTQQQQHQSAPSECSGGKSSDSCSSSNVS